MKRSEINAITHEANAYIRESGFHLPPFAYWTIQDWRTKGQEVREIIENHLGWDITDFGSGTFRSCGLLLFTLRNGKLDNLKNGRGKVYAEKIMVVEIDQVTPLHFHWTKTEDIINRGGGELVMQLYNSTPDEKLASTDVVVSIDGVMHSIKAGATIVLTPGESITLTTGLYHTFWGAKSRVLVGEISLVNDDSGDNRFFEPVGRFPVIEEDEPPLYLLCNDYANYYRVQ